MHFISVTDCHEYVIRIGFTVPAESVSLGVPYASVCVCVCVCVLHIVMLEPLLMSTLYVLVFQVNCS